MLKKLEDIYNKSNQENVFLVNKIGRLKNKLLKLKKTENNIFKVFSINLLSNTENEEFSFEPIPALLNNSKLAINELNRRIFAFIFNLEVIELINIENHEAEFLGFSDFHKSEFLKKMEYLNNNFEKQSYSSEKRKRNALFYNEETNLYSLVFFIPATINSFSERKNTSTKEVFKGITNYLNSFDKSFIDVKNKIVNDPISSECTFYDFYLSFNFSYKILYKSNYSIEDVLKYYPLGSYKNIDNSILLNKEKLIKMFDNSFLYGFSENNIKIEDYVFKDNNIFGYVGSQHNPFNPFNPLISSFSDILSLYSLLTIEEYSVVSKFVLEPFYLEMSKKKAMALLGKPNNINKEDVKNKKIIEDISKIKKLIDKINLKYKKNDITSIFNKEYLKEHLNENNELNLCISNEAITLINCNYPIILGYYLLKIKKLNIFSLVDNVEYVSISSSGNTRHKGSGNGLNCELKNIPSIKITELLEFINRNFFINSSDETTINNRVFEENETLVKSKKTTLVYKPNSFEIDDDLVSKYNISEIYKQIMTIDHMLNYKIKYVLKLEDFSE